MPNFSSYTFFTRWIRSRTLHTRKNSSASWLSGITHIIFLEGQIVGIICPIPSKNSWVLGISWVWGSKLLKKPYFITRKALIHVIMPNIAQLLNSIENSVIGQDEDLMHHKQAMLLKTSTWEVVLHGFMSFCREVSHQNDPTIHKQRVQPNTWHVPNHEHQKTVTQPDPQSTKQQYVSRIDKLMLRISSPPLLKTNPSQNSLQRCIDETLWRIQIILRSTIGPNGGRYALILIHPLG